MPELPEVETVRRGLEPVLVGRRLVRVEQRRPDLRFRFPERFAERLEGTSVEALRRRAKYLLADLSSGEVLVMHLGMSGRFRVETGREAAEPGAFYYDSPPAPAHDHVVFWLSDGARVTYNDARRFGFMSLYDGATIEASPPFAGMGIEPLGTELSGDALADLFRGKRTPLKAALLDQRLVAGLGNIYVCEALFRARLSPEAPAGSLVTASGRPKAKAHALSEAIKAVLEEAVAHGGSTLRDHAQVDGTAGAMQERFRVYDREGEPCMTPGCRGVIGRIVQSGRSTFHCPLCQR
ncbi:bifunctional DNA-formamidopyrimidine glycosylase/DNA-(apurinic or apyrimidinic site) lyase [Enterovirga aerilata]|uniref:Formamidopyrimidine-DNA glycosylase n=1 Tax=Enterovirga aerilata TaxID=2730920 RepID=A0A849I1D9_9HYPH|nr:bifunctional DNA-formamidopyrimidine glycosylase/DNA-(apurinic or apyrimidinic site) lyase [Enterovirga sp. DB1703]NNM71158.1 bifunctional DNA-formamidopyrimidine glycosylase/DNA-(apurinic or apyrimidinic site) lyase [Enterovirga sp. DB1703]